MSIAELFALAGDVGVWAIVAVLWRFDRRIVRLELQQSAIVKDLGEHIQREESKLDRLLEKMAR